MKEITPITTFYNGYKFRSRLEARWAVFFDYLGVEYEYEPEGYVLQNGECYLPDFLIHTGRRNSRTPTEFYVEVKGKPNEKDGQKVNLFSKRHPIIIVGGLYDIFVQEDPKYNFLEILALFQNCHSGFESKCILNGFDYIDGDSYPCVIGASEDGGIELYGADWFSTCKNPMDEAKTIKAIQKARQARFEFKETPCQYKIGTILDFSHLKSFKELDYRMNPYNFIESKTGVIVDIVSNKDDKKTARVLLKNWNVRSFPIGALEKLKDEVRIVGHCNVNEFKEKIWRVEDEEK